MKTLSVINHRKFAYFDYTSEKNETPFQLGVIVIKESNNEIGVILQTYANGEFRTDMFGNSGDYECRLATIEEVKEFRPEIIEDIKVSKFKILNVAKSIVNPKTKECVKIVKVQKIGTGFVF